MVERLQNFINLVDCLQKVISLADCLQNFIGILFLLFKLTYCGAIAKSPSRDFVKRKHNNYVIYLIILGGRRHVDVGRDRLEIRISDSTSDSPKPSDRFDNFETKIRNCETCLEAGLMVSSVIYKDAGVEHRYKTIMFYCICEPVT